MTKRIWFWAIAITLFPPLLFIPLVYYFFYLPLKNGVIGGSRLRFYYWGSLVAGLSVFAAIPLPKAKSLQPIYDYLIQSYYAEYFLLASFALSVLSIVIMFVSTRNEVDQKQFLAMRKFRPDKLFFLFVLLAFFPYVSFLFTKNSISYDDIRHPFAFAIASVFGAKYYFATFIGFLTISVTTAIIEESFFRGILLRDYFHLSRFKRNALLLVAALYFGFCHMPVSFLFPFLFGLCINRVRLGYNNLLPGVILHALWNANLIIVTLLLLDVKAARPITRTFNEELGAIAVVWEHKKLDQAKTLFPKYKIEKNLQIFNGQHVMFFVATDSTMPNDITTLFIALPDSIEVSKIEGLFQKNDWETKSFKIHDAKDGEKISVRCSKKQDLCYDPKQKSPLMMRFGFYDMSIF